MGGLKRHHAVWCSHEDYVLTQLIHRSVPRELINVLLGRGDDEVSDRLGSGSMRPKAISGLWTAFSQHYTPGAMGAGWSDETVATDLGWKLDTLEREALADFRRKLVSIGSAENASVAADGDGGIVFTSGVKPDPQPVASTITLSDDVVDAIVGLKQAREAVTSVTNKITYRTPGDAARFAAVETPTAPEIADAVVEALEQKRKSLQPAPPTLPAKRTFPRARFTDIAAASATSALISRGVTTAIIAAGIPAEAVSHPLAQILIKLAAPAVAKAIAARTGAPPSVMRTLTAAQVVSTATVAQDSVEALYAQIGPMMEQIAAIPVPKAIPAKT